MSLTILMKIVSSDHMELNSAANASLVAAHCQYSAILLQGAKHIADNKKVHKQKRKNNNKVCFKDIQQGENGCFPRIYLSVTTRIQKLC